jgi:hypothetical protein
MTEALAVVFLALTALHIIAAVGYAAGGGKVANSTGLQGLGVVEGFIALALAISVVA